MSVWAQHLVTSGSGTDANSYNTASITPQSNWLVLAAVISSTGGTGGNVPTLSGNGLTWVQIDTQVEAGDIHRLTLFRALGSASAGAVTIDFASQTQTYCAWSISHVAQTDTSGTNGSGAIVQSAKATGGGGSSHSVTLAAFADADNGTFGALGLPGNRAVTPGSGFTELGEFGQSSPNVLTVETEWRRDNDTTVDWSWTTALAAYNGIAIELKEITTGIRVTPIVADTSGTDATSHTTASFNVVSGRLYLIGWSNRVGSGTANIPTFTSSGGETVDEFANAQSGVICTSGAWFVASSTGTRTVTADYASQTNAMAAWTVDEFIDANTTTPIVQSKSGTGTSTTPGVTLDSAISNSGNATWGALGTVAGASGTAVAAGFIELGETAQVESSLLTASEFKLNSTTTSWVTSNAAYRTVAAEINSVIAVNGTATPSAIAVPITVPQTAGSASHSATPSAIAVSATLPTPSLSAGGTSTPDVVLVSLALPSPTLVADSTATPNIVSVPVTLPTPTIAAAGDAVPAAILVPVTIPSAAVTAGGTATPDAIPVPITIPQVAATGTGAGTANPAPITVLATLPSPDVSGTGVAAPSPIDVPVAIPQATGSASQTATPDAIPIPATFPTPTTSGTGTATPDAIPVPITFPPPTVTATNPDGTATPGPITVGITLPPPTLSIPKRGSRGQVQRRYATRRVTFTIPVVYAARVSTSLDFSFEEEELELLLMVGV